MRYRLKQTVLQDHGITSKLIWTNGAIPKEHIRENTATASPLADFRGFHTFSKRKAHRIQ